MASIFSVQNLQTFLRRKYFRPPSREPPGPPGRGPRGPRSLRSGRLSPPLRSGRASLVGAGVLISSAIVLLRTSDLPGVAQRFSAAINPLFDVGLQPLRSRR